MNNTDFMTMRICTVQKPQFIVVLCVGIRAVNRINRQLTMAIPYGRVIDAPKTFLNSKQIVSCQHFLEKLHYFKLLLLHIYIACYDK